MKAFLALMALISIVPVSIMTMMWGWGLEAHNWGWISFGYLWMLVQTLVGAALKE
ncbi:MAG: hypothetical protein WBL28_05215 [Methylotenera sp.]